MKRGETGVVCIPLVARGVGDIYIVTVSASIEQFLGNLTLASLQIMVSTAHQEHFLRARCYLTRGKCCPLSRRVRSAACWDGVMS